MIDAAAPWMDTARSPDERADLLIAELTLDEMISLVHGPMPNLMNPPPADAARGAGYIPGVARLGIPPLNETDASLGVTNPRKARPGDGGTGLPSGLALASAWDAELAYEAGAMVGSEARDKGFNVLLGGGANLTREPRCGRNFEYLGEDPLLAGVLAGQAIKGAQSNGVVCTLKHFALNDQETCRHVVDARIEEGPLRESDLLAFQIAIEQGDPGAVMCAYNKLNGDWAGENEFLLTQVLRRDWGWKGWVMSDWGAVHTTAKAALAGMDQESGEQLDKQVFFGAPLKEAVEQGEVPFERLAEMVHRILRSLIDKGVFDAPAAPRPTDYVRNSEVALRAAEAGIVLLKNADSLLPITRQARRVAVIGGHADAGVISGGGSSQVIPLGDNVLEIGLDQQAGPIPRTKVFHPSAPLAAIRAQAPQTQVVFHDGADAAAAAELARTCDIAIVFATQWATEAEDLPNLSLPDRQDELIAAVAAANRKTVVVLETGTPVLAPWLDQVGAVLQAWYAGTRGGEAIGRILYGEVNPSGRLPISFPRSTADLVRPEIPGQIFGPPVEGKTLPTSLPDVQQHKGRFSVEHPEGADVGYRWFYRQGIRTLFPFGFGLSYTEFAFGGLRVTGGATVEATFEITNTGDRAGTETAQVYAQVAGGQRLIGWARATLKPGETRRVTVVADPRLLATYDVALPGWRIAPGPVEVTICSDAETVLLTGEAVLEAGTLKP
jgi:beta-glucosidase